MRPRTAAPVVFACAVLLAAGAGEAWARGRRQGGASHQSAAGRHHLKKANELAGHNKCHHALHEYTVAYAKLHDPVVLFNRAECYRRLGDDVRAAADYRAFLKGVPDAPNREEIEARIASLEGDKAPAAEAQDTAEPEAKPKPRSKADPEPAAAEPAPEPEPEADPAAAKVAAPAPAPKVKPVPALEVAGPPATLLEAPPPAASEKREGSQGHVHWWLLAALAVVVAGGATAGYLLLRPRGQIIPGTDLGDYKF
jgi:hypothetical protein